MSLLVQTASGPIQGFADTFPLRNESSAYEIESTGVNGGLSPVLKWLVSLYFFLLSRRTGIQS